MAKPDFYIPKKEARRNKCPDCGRTPDYVTRTKRYDQTLDRDEITSVYDHAGIHCFSRWPEKERIFRKGGLALIRLRLRAASRAASVGLWVDRSDTSAEQTLCAHHTEEAKMGIYISKKEARRNKCPDCGRKPDYVTRTKRYDQTLDRDEITSVYSHADFRCLETWSGNENIFSKWGLALIRLRLRAASVLDRYI